jgi:ribosomal protein L4
MSEKVVAISLLVAKSIEFGKSKATKLIAFLKKISCNLKNSRLLRLHQSILVIINRSFACN